MHNHLIGHEFLKFQAFSLGVQTWSDGTSLQCAVGVIEQIYSDLLHTCSKTMLTWMVGRGSLIDTTTATPPVQQRDDGYVQCGVDYATTRAPNVFDFYRGLVDLYSKFYDKCVLYIFQPSWLSMVSTPCVLCKNSCALEKQRNCI